MIVETSASKTKCSDLQYPFYPIAEGSERGGKDFNRFPRIALRSAAELRTQVYIAQRIAVFADTDAGCLIADLKEITGLRLSLKTEN